MKINDIVRLLPYPEDSINGYGRITYIDENTVIISNMNMPFQGTFANEEFNIEQVEG